MHRFNHILLWIQLDTNLFELGMQNSQLTLHLVISLRYLSPHICEIGGGGAFKPIRPSVYWFVCPSFCLSLKL